MAYIFRFYNNDVFYEFEISSPEKFSVGTDKDTIRLPSMNVKRKYIEFSKEEREWKYKFHKTAEHVEQTAGKIGLGITLTLDKEKRIMFVILDRTPDFTTTVDISKEDKLQIGRSSSCDVVLHDKTVSSAHLLLERVGDAWKLENIGKNGTYVNGKKVEEALISSDDNIDIGLCRLIFTNQSILVSCLGKVEVNLKLVETPIRRVEQRADEYPWVFKRSPRLMEEIPSQEMEFQVAPNIGGKPDISWISVLVPPITSILLMLMVSFLMGGAKTMLYFSVPMSIVGVSMSIYNCRRQLKKYRKIESLRITKYEEYLAEQEKKIQQLQKVHKMILNSIHPSVSECFSIASEPARRLWERRPVDPDFMDLRIGMGTEESKITYRLPRQTLSLEADVLVNYPELITNKYKEVKGVPIICQMGKMPSCGIIGSRQNAITVTKNMVVQAVTHHSYEDLRIVLIYNKKENSEWGIFRWLPHVFDDTRQVRYIVDSQDSAKKVLSLIEEELIYRRQEKDLTSNQRPIPFYLFICADEGLVEKHSIMQYLKANDKKLSVGAIFLFNDIHNLPKECITILDIRENSGQIYPKSNVSQRKDFALDRLSPEIYERFSRALSPIRIENMGGQGSLPNVITLLEGLKVNRPSEIEDIGKWDQVYPEKSMAVPIGIRNNGEHFYFDIHEKQHGPHGLVAGMTGSGKSEMVQSWILSMAIKFPPEAVSFVLIDFKGTGLILPFRNLPHLAGTISDLDTNIRRNLTALENELVRRKALLDENEVSNIADYLKLYREKKVDTPLSYLFIVIDEFAEFKVQFPDFVEVINRVFAIGRTLGVRIILLTQKPANVVDDKMNANTRFRWCLKVASSADSKDMIRHPDASRIKCPGRAFVQVGEDEVFEEIQSYWSGAPYNPYHDNQSKYAAKVSIVDIYGNRKSYEPDKSTGYRAEKNEIDAIVEYLDDYTRKNNVSRARNIWTHKLNNIIYLSDILNFGFDGERWVEQEPGLSPIVGMLDDPRSQSQYPLKLDLLEQGHYAIYGAPGTGKTTFIQSIIMSLALSYQPDVLSLYLLDFGGGSLGLFRNLPHVGGVVRDFEEEKLRKLTTMLSTELEERKHAFSDLGVISLEAYKEASNVEISYIVLILDNFAPIHQLDQYYDQFFQNLTREGAGYGIYLILTANIKSAIPYRIEQNIKAPIVLRMADRADYSNILGRTEGMVPEDFPGRGLIAGKPPLEFQVALPVIGNTENQRIANIRQFIQIMDEKWQGERPPIIQVMPEKVTTANYNGDRIFLGLDYELILPCTVDVRESPFFIVAYKFENFKGIWNHLINQYCNQYPDSKLTIYHEQQIDAVVQQITQPTEFDQYIADLMIVMDERRKYKREHPVLPPEKFPYIIIMIENIKKCFDDATNETMKRLAKIVSMGEKLNVAVITMGKLSDIEYLYHGGDVFTSYLVKRQNALMMGGNLRDYNIFGLSQSAFMLNETMAEQDGYLMRSGSLKLIKTVQ